MSQRSERLKLAVIFSVGSKLVRFGSQAIIVGIAVRYLGAEAYGAWLTVVAALGWLAWGQAGLAPGLVNALATAEGEGRWQDQGLYFSTALAVILAIVVGLFIAGQAALYWGGPWLGDLLLPDDPSTADLNTDEWAAFLQVGLLLALLRLPLGLVESAFVGLQQIHVLRVFDMFGQAFCVAAVLLMAAGAVPSAMFLLGVGLVTECGVLAAGLYLVTRLRPELFPSMRKVSLRASGRMFDLSGGYLIVQVTGYMVTHGGILILAGAKGSVSVILFALAWQLYQMASGLWMMVMTGLWGGLGEAQAAGDWAWIRKAVRRLIMGAMALSLAFSAGLAILGPLFVELWTGGRVSGDRLFFLTMAANCSIFTWAVLHAQILSALNLVWKQIWATAANGILFLPLAFMLVPRFDAAGLAAASFLACALSTAWVYPALLSRILVRGRHVPA